MPAQPDTKPLRIEALRRRLPAVFDGGPCQPGICGSCAQYPIFSALFAYSSL